MLILANVVVKLLLLAARLILGRSLQVTRIEYPEHVAFSFKLKNADVRNSPLADLIFPKQLNHHDSSERD